MSDTTLSTRWGATEPGTRAQLFFGVEEPKDVNIDGDRPVKVRIAFVKGPDGEVIRGRVRHHRRRYGLAHSPRGH